tara:strand:- start:67 stop:405 length:339 start_codon:yes stop_codon:yes gene_type:complete
MNKETSVILEMLRHIVNQPNSTQRDLARGLNLSLGKVNYCMKALKEKGYIKINNFKKNPDKISYAYILTPKGIKEKTKLTVNFMKRKMIEYEDLKKDLANDVKKNEKQIKKY